MSAAPLFVVAAPFCGASRLAATLGSHPQLCAIPETGVFVADTVAELLEIFEVGQGSNADGLLRAIGVLEFGGVDDDAIAAAQAWLAERGDWRTADVLAHLAERAAPRRLVVPDTEAGLRPGDLLRLRAGFADAAVVHLVRHPWTSGALFAPWLDDRLFVGADFRDAAAPLAPVDPQIAWLRINRNIESLLLPGFAGRVLHVRDEQLQDDRLGTLAAIAGLAGVANDVTTIAALDAAQWPFCGYGPRSAPYGLEAELLDAMTPDYGAATLDAPLPWRADGKPFAPDVAALARHYGY